MVKQTKKAENRVDFHLLEL